MERAVGMAIQYSGHFSETNFRKMFYRLEVPGGLSLESRL